MSKEVKTKVGTIGGLGLTLGRGRKTKEDIAALREKEDREMMQLLGCVVDEIRPEEHEDVKSERSERVARTRAKAVEAVPVEETVPVEEAPQPEEQKETSASRVVPVTPVTMNGEVPADAQCGKQAETDPEKEEEPEIAEVQGNELIDSLLRGGAKRVFVARYDVVRADMPDGIKTFPKAFESEEALQKYINSLSHERGPMRAGTLPGGAKYSAVLPPVAVSGATMNIVNFPGFYASDADYINTKMASQDMLDFLRLCVMVGESVIIIGPEKCGKTTLLNHILKQLKGTDRMVLSIESRKELDIECGLLIRQQTDEASGVTMPLLCAAAGMQMADVVAVDEIDTESVIALSDSLGEKVPVYAAIRANNSVAMINNLNSYGTDARIEQAPFNEKVMKVLSVLVRIDIPENMGVRRIISVSLLTEGKQGQLCEKEIFRFDRKLGQFTRSGYTPDGIIRKAMEKGIEVDRKQFFAKTEESEEA